MRRISETKKKNGEKHCGYWRWDGWMRYLFLGLNVEEQLELEKTSRLIQAINACLRGGYGIDDQYSLQQITNRIEGNFRRFLEHGFLKQDHDDEEAKKICITIFKKDLWNFLNSKHNYGIYTVGTLLLDLGVKKGISIYTTSFDKLKIKYEKLKKSLFD